MAPKKGAIKNLKKGHLQVLFALAKIMFNVWYGSQYHNFSILN